MRLLANENVPAAAVAALRQAGHDVAWVAEVARGSADEAVVRAARDQGRILVTFDKDFGELAFRSGLTAECGVILCRFRPASASVAAERLVLALASREDWHGHFAVVEDDRVRLTPLPSVT